MTPKTVSSFRVLDRVRWLENEEYRYGTVTAIGHKYVHVFDGAASPGDRTKSLLPWQLERWVREQ